MQDEMRTVPDPRIQGALQALKEIVLRRYPQATFVVAEGDDPKGIRLKTIVDADDTDKVFDLLVERLLELKIDEELLIYFIPLRSMERVARTLREPAAKAG